MIRAYIREDLPGMYLSVSIVQHFDGRARQILRLENPGSQTAVRWEELPDPPTGDVEPTLQLGDSEAHALLLALTRHYSGADDTRALRRDYDAERKRVDQLTASLIGVTHALANKGTPEPVLTEQQWRPAHRGALIAMGNQPVQPGKYYTLGKLRFEHQTNGRWGVTNRMRGVCNYRTPLGAWFAFRRMVRRGDYGPPQ